MQYSTIVPVLLIAIGVLGISFFIVTSLVRLKKKRTKAPAIKNEIISATDEPSSSLPESEKISIAAATKLSPGFHNAAKPSGILTDFFRAFLIALTLIVAAGFALILLPSPTMDAVTRGLQERYALSRQDMIALLYLGDEVTGNSFRIRSVVRNITTSTIEQLDASIRLYASDGKLQETVVVRTDRESIAPDEIAYLELFYPDYQAEFARYVVEFKLRGGASVSYKDMRPFKKQQDQEP